MKGAATTGRGWAAFVLSALARISIAAVCLAGACTAFTSTAVSLAVMWIFVGGATFYACHRWGDRRRRQ
jgi:hypothetical protein